MLTFTLTSTNVCFTTVHRWNSLLCPPLGFLFNAVLIWLILRRTPKEMRVHSRILLQTCAMDCLLLVSQCVGQTAVTFDRSSSYFVLFYDGFFVRQFKALQNPLFLLYFYSLWIVALQNLSFFGTALQFIYRYLVLNRNMKITLLHYLLLISGITLYIFGITTMILLGTVDTLNKHPIDRERFGPFVDFEQQPLFITDETERNIPLLVGTGGYALLAIVTYTIICICGWKIVRFVRKHSTLSDQLRELNRQLTKCLIILACIPMFLAFVSVIFVYGIFSDQKSSADWTLEWELYLVLARHWIPAVLNPVVTIYVNRPYRDAVIGRFVSRISPIQNE